MGRRGRAVSKAGSWGRGPWQPLQRSVTGAPQRGRVTPCAGTTPASGPPLSCSAHGSPCAPACPGRFEEGHSRSTQSCEEKESGMRGYTAQPRLQTSICCRLGLVTSTPNRTAVCRLPSANVPCPVTCLALCIISFIPLNNLREVLLFLFIRENQEE